MKTDAGGSMCYWSNLSVLERNAYDLLQIPVLFLNILIRRAHSAKS